MVAILICLTAVSGCADIAAKPARHPATKSISGDVRLSDAIPLESIQTDDVEIKLTDKMDSLRLNQTIYFGQANEFDSDEDQVPAESLPLIAIKSDDRWKAVPLSGPGLRNAGWKFVGIGPTENEVWGVLDDVTNESSPDFVIAHSIDGASTFTLKVFHKPSKLAEWSDFAMSRNGRGRVTVTLDTNCGIYKPGLYHFETTDDGTTWSKLPKFESDVMIRADSVSEDEQPDLSSGPTRILINTPRHPTKKR